MNRFATTAFFLSLLAAARCDPRAFTKRSYSRVFTGDGTYYGFTAGGNCAMRDTLPSMYKDMLPIAINDKQYAYSRSCGACIRILSSGEGAGNDPIPAPTTAYVHDRCPECKIGDIDLSKSGDGRWKVEWEFIPCPNAGLELQALFEGSNRYYWKLQIRGTRSPVETLVADGKTGVRSQDNFFIIDQKMPDAADVVVKTVLGETVRFRLPRWVENGLVKIEGGASEQPEQPEKPERNSPTPSPSSLPSPSSTPTSIPTPSPSTIPRASKKSFSDENEGRSKDGSTRSSRKKKDRKSVRRQKSNSKTPSPSPSTSPEKLEFLGDSEIMNQQGARTCKWERTCHSWFDGVRNRSHCWWSWVCS